MNNVETLLYNKANWKLTKKKIYTISMCVPNVGTRVHNRLENSDYVTSRERPIVLRGTANEEWVIDCAKLGKTYTFADGTPITADGLKQRLHQGSGSGVNWISIKTKPDTVLNWALHLPLWVKNFPVQTSWGDVLLANRDGIGHYKGDFLLTSYSQAGPNFNDMWVVNGEIFPKTYNMKAFPNF